MAQHKYSTKIENQENSAKAVGISLPISTKQSVEICRFIRNKSLEKAKTMLANVIVKKTAVPFKRYKMDVGHRRGKIAAGRYPMKASKQILDLLNSVETNAQFKGLNTSNLVITHICAHLASTPPHYGRRRRKTKRTHVEVVVEEKAEKKAETPKKEVKKDTKKIEKKEVPKQEKKLEVKK